MMLIYMKSGQCIEVEPATSALRVDKILLCFDRRGAVVASYPATEVEAYTSSPEVAEALLANVCEDLEVVPAGGETESTETRG